MLYDDTGQVDWESVTRRRRGHEKVGQPSGFSLALDEHCAKEEVSVLQGFATEVSTRKTRDCSKPHPELRRTVSATSTL